jgi:hypothetical protein
MAFKSLRLLPIFATAALLGACASDGGSGGLFSTASVVPPAQDEAKMAAKPRVDPQCVTLTSQIDQLRKEGTIERLEKVAAGKSDNVQVKRTAIAKQAELNKANAEFQASQEAATPTVSPVAAAAVMKAAPAAAKTAATAAKAVPSGVTVATPAVKTQ